MTKMIGNLFCEQKVTLKHIYIIFIDKRTKKIKQKIRIQL